MEIDERNTKTLTLRDGPLEKLWGGRGIFEPHFPIFFRYQIPFMKFFRP